MFDFARSKPENIAGVSENKDNKDCFDVSRWSAKMCRSERMNIYLLFYQSVYKVKERFAALWVCFLHEKKSTRNLVEFIQSEWNNSVVIVYKTQNKSDFRAWLRQWL